MKVFFHEKADVDGCDGKKESSLILLHFLNQTFILSDKFENQLQGQNSTSSEICLGILTLKPKFHPFFSRSFNYLDLAIFFKVFSIQILDQIPPFITTLKQNVGLISQGIKFLKFLCR